MEKLRYPAIVYSVAVKLNCADVHLNLTNRCIDSWFAIYVINQNCPIILLKVFLHAVAPVQRLGLPCAGRS